MLGRATPGLQHAIDPAGLTPPVQCAYASSPDMLPSTDLPTSPAAAPTGEGRARRFVRKLGPAGPLGAVMVGLPFVGAAVLLGTLHRLGPWLKSHASPGVLLLSTAAIAVLAGLTLAPTYMLAVVAGWAFGAAGGMAATVAGITAAACIGFAICRGVVGDRVLGAVHDDPRTDAVRRAMLGSGPFRAATIVALLRLAPVVPFGATNLLMASAGCPALPFVLGTFVGSIPRTAVIVAMAARMSELDFEQKPELAAAGAVVTVVVIVVLSVLGKKALSSVTRESAPGVQQVG
jgi:uncharacterized membrane protein YdjX (TVP38/TMEM64 family)